MSHADRGPTAPDGHVPLPFPGAYRGRRPAVGMIHLPALPGAPLHQGGMGPVLEAAEADARTLAGAGVDGIFVENFGDVPFHGGRVPPETVAAMTRAVALVREVAGGLPVGVNILRNDADAALAVATAAGAAFIRVNVHVGTMWTDQGALTGRAGHTLRRRPALHPTCAILADVHVKHATPLPGESLEDAARDCWHRGRADALVVSGTGTGRSTDPERVRRVVRAVPDAPVWIGSGATPETLPDLWPVAHGFIVGSALQRDGRAGNRVDRERASRFMAAVRRLREEGAGGTETSGPDAPAGPAGDAR